MKEKQKLGDTTMDCFDRPRRGQKILVDCDGEWEELRQEFLRRGIRIWKIGLSVVGDAVRKDNTETLIGFPGWQTDPDAAYVAAKERFLELAGAVLRRVAHSCGHEISSFYAEVKCYAGSGSVVLLELRSKNLVLWTGGRKGPDNIRRGNEKPTAVRTAIQRPAPDTALSPRES